MRSASRFLLLVPFLLACAIFTATAWAGSPLTASQQVQDFDVLWRTLDTDYAYLDGARTRWQGLRASARHAARSAGSRADFIAVLEGTIATLHDDNVTLSTRSPGARRSVPYENDIWASWKAGAAIVEAVRVFGDADAAGLRPGDVVTRVDGVPIERAAHELLGAAPRTPVAMDWAVRHVLAGPRLGTQRVEITEARPERVFVIEHAPAVASTSSLAARRMGDARDIGYIRLRAGDENLAAHFDQALRQILDTRALIFDLRDSAGVGSRPVTRAILGRFVSRARPWQLREARGKPRVADRVEPRGEMPYAKPVVVLVDRWTAGEGEALAEGLRTVAGARIVGTRTAGLRGEVREITLPNSEVALRYPAEKTFRVNGEPRGEVRPDIEVDLAAPRGGPGDPILYQALKLLEPCPGPACRSARDSPPPAREFPPR
ncbi:MAG: S41 family peptidase [Usitatibacter sp.]